MRISRDALTRWIAPILIAIVLGILTYQGTAMWAHHTAQHREAEQDHQILMQVIQYLNTQAVKK